MSLAFVARVALALALASPFTVAAQSAPAPAPAIRVSPAAAPDAALVDFARSLAVGRVVASGRAALPGGEAVVAVAHRPPGRPGPILLVGVVTAGEAGGFALAGRDDIEALDAPGEVALTIATEPLAVAAGAFSVTAQVKLPDGSVDELTALFRYTGKVSRLLVLPPVRRAAPGSLSPSVTREVSLLPTRTAGYLDLRVTTRKRTCAKDGDCADQVEVGSYALDGLRYAARPYAVPSVEKITASSTLMAKGQLADHSAASAIDGRLDTSWCEGAKGAGWFEKLELTLAPAQKLVAVGVVPGRGTGEPFREATRPKRLRILLPDGRKVEGNLADDPTRQRIALPPGDRVFGVTVQIVDVYKGKKEEACIAELELEVEP